MNNKRGRPPNAVNLEITTADEIIGRTARCLIMWGFSERGQVYPVVAKLALRILNRGDHLRLKLSDERIKQIYEAWVNRATDRKQGWKLSNGAYSVGARAGIQKESLADRIPDKTMTLEQLTITLLKNDGSWPSTPGFVRIYHGDNVLTKKRHEAWLKAPRFKSSP